MPPKGQKGSKPNAKTEEKKKQKVVEDKTFGLKNKKGGKQQKFIKHVEKQTLNTGKTSRELDKAKADLLKKKKEADDLNNLFKPVEQKVMKGVDPKSVLCAFFKQGNCGKGAKCKFSHDLTIARKIEKKNIYEDDKKEDTMENWDDAHLADVVNQKHGEKEKKKPKTAIICKFFLDAVENSKYGWFWECPNGGADCHYRHALPPGFVLKKDKKLMDEQKIEISLEELIEKERASLGSTLTKVTLESFLQWKERKRKEKIAQMKKDMDKKKNDYKAGRAIGLSGRDLFEFNPDLILGDDDEAEATYEREKDDDEEEMDNPFYREINLDDIGREAREVDGSGTVSTSSKREGLPSHLDAGDTKPKKDDEDTKLNEAAALPPESITQNATAAIGEALASDVPIDENLFDGDDLDLDEDLDALDLDD